MNSLWSMVLQKILGRRIGGKVHLISPLNDLRKLHQFHNPIQVVNTGYYYTVVHESLMPSIFKISLPLLTNFHCITITTIFVLVAHRYLLRLTSIGDRFDPRGQHPNFAPDGYSIVLKLIIMPTALLDQGYETSTDSDPMHEGLIVKTMVRLKFSIQ